ncbi:MAG: DUF5996 family protein [Bacteroidia bacterium]
MNAISLTKNKNSAPRWPEINFPEMQDTIETLHQWIQIVGKIRLRTMPWQNHSWHCTLYITSTGFSTHGIPYRGLVFQIDFDFKQHKIFMHCSDTDVAEMDLRPMTVAQFYHELFDKLRSIGIDVEIHPSPNEVDPAIPFADNTVNKSYDPEASSSIWQAMLRANGVFHKFRSEFIGKASPVHLFWGAFDLAVTRFSGNAAPLHPGGVPNMSLEVMQEAYSQEVSSAGFWLGSKAFPIPVFYAYAYPAAPEFGAQKVLPKEAFYDAQMGEYFLKYEDVRKAENPGQTLHDFLQTTYEAVANTAKWNRKKIEK